MKIISVNVGLPREVPWEVDGDSHGQASTVLTGIFKDPVSGPVRVLRLDLEGDQQADLSVHGGIHKAVYAYPSEHYAYWRRELPGEKLPWGSFGENLTTEGLLEDALNIGDRLRMGTAELVVTQPRMPCYKLGIRFGRPDMVKRFLFSRRSGFYFLVAREGELQAGAAIELIARDTDSLTVADINNLYVSERNDPEMLRRAAALQALPESWRGYFEEQLQRTIS